MSSGGIAAEAEADATDSTEDKRAQPRRPKHIGDWSKCRVQVVGLVGDVVGGEVTVTAGDMLRASGVGSAVCACVGWGPDGAHTADRETNARKPPGTFR